MKNVLLLILIPSSPDSQPGKDNIQSRPASDKYASGWDRIFGQKNDNVKLN